MTESFEIEVRRSSSVPQNTTVLIRTPQRAPPSTVAQVKAELRLAALQPPKPTTRKLAREIKEKPHVHWRLGYVEGVSYSLRLLEGVHP